MRSIMELREMYDNLDQGPQAIVLVVAFAILFLLLEFSMTHTPIARGIAALLRQNKQLSDTEVKRCVPMVVTRIVGSIHNSIQVPIAVWAITNGELRADRFYATHPLTHVMLCAAGGFFLHDAVSCFIRESPFYIVHGLTCCLGYTVGAAYGVCHFYGGLFLMWEVSTPFVQLRWVLHKMGRADTTLYKVNGILMFVTFGVARILFGTYFTGLLLMDTWRELTQPAPRVSVGGPLNGDLSGDGAALPDEVVKGSDVPPAIWLGFCAAALTVSTLNYYWFSLMMKTMVQILRHGHSWGQASENKHD